MAERFCAEVNTTISFPPGSVKADSDNVIVRIFGLALSDIGLTSS
jgi:hypothetical protein